MPVGLTCGAQCTYSAHIEETLLNSLQVQLTNGGNLLRSLVHFQSSTYTHVRTDMNMGVAVC